MNRPKIPRPNREKTKTQVTARMDTQLLKALKARGEAEGLNLTDVIEQAAWLYLHRHGEDPVTIQGRFLWNHVPIWLQRVTLAFWAFVFEPIPDPKHWQTEHTRKFAIDYTMLFAKEFDMVSRLRKLVMHPEAGGADNQLEPGASDIQCGNHSATARFT